MHLAGRHMEGHATQIDYLQTIWGIWKTICKSGDQDWIVWPRSSNLGLEARMSSSFSVRVQRLRCFSRAEAMVEWRKDSRSSSRSI